jgi:hypothetical protein
MAVLFTDQPTPSGNDTANVTLYPTGAATGWASWTPPAGQMVFVFVMNSFAGADTIPTMDDAVATPDNGLVWTLIDTLGFSTLAATTRRISLFAALSSGATAGKLNVNFGATGQTGCAICVVTALNVNVLGVNAANAIRLHINAGNDTAAKTAAVALAAFLSANNATLAAAAINGADTMVKDVLPAGYILGTQQGYATPNNTECAQWLGAYDALPQMTWTNNNRWAIIAAEIVSNEGPNFDAAASSAYQPALSTYSFSHTTTTNPNRILVVTVSVFAAGTVTGITYNGVALTHQAAADVANGVYRSEVWYLVAPATGANTVAVTLSGVSTSIANSLSYWNVDQGAPIEATATNTGTGDTMSVAVTTLTRNATVVANLTTPTVTAITDAAGQQARDTNNGVLGASKADDKGPVVTPASTTLSWTGAGVTDTWSASAIALATPNLMAQAVL